MATTAEENYLKAIYHLNQDREGKRLRTNELADYLVIAPSTVSNMLLKLSEKGLIAYKKYGAIALSDSGNEIALSVLRKHRLWETFLYEKLGFSWDEIHEVAEELEHINSPKLIDKLDELLGHPEYDPHGDPIPKPNGEHKDTFKTTLSMARVGKEYKIVAVKNSSAAFLQYASEIGIELEANISVNSRLEFDGSMEIEIGGMTRTISHKIAENVYVD